MGLGNRHSERRALRPRRGEKEDVETEGRAAPGQEEPCYRHPLEPWAAGPVQRFGQERSGHTGVPETLAEREKSVQGTGGQEGGRDGRTREAGGSSRSSRGPGQGRQIQ